MTVAGVGARRGAMTEEEGTQSWKMSVSCDLTDNGNVRGKQATIIAMACSIIETVHVNIVSLRLE